MVQSVVLLIASRGNASQALRDAATAYKVDTDAIAAKVKQEFAAREKTKTVKSPSSKQIKKVQAKPTKRAAA